MNKVIILGIRDESYADKKTGELKHARELHMMLPQPQQPQDGFRGNKVQTCLVKFDVSGIELNKVYIPEWELQQFGAKQSLTLIGLTPYTPQNGEK